MKYFNSYKLFHGINQFRNTVILILINLVILAGTGVAVRVSDSEAFCGFMTGSMPLICGALVAAVCYAMICNVFSGVMRTNSGYRFFRSIADGAEHFRRGIIAANMLSLIPIVLYAAVGGVLFQHFIIIIMTVTLLFMNGLVNLTGQIKAPWLRIAVFAVIGFAYGFYAGANDSEGFVELPFNVTVIVCAVTAVFYIISLIVVAFRAEKLWNKED